jgi:TonB-dependent receptor
MRPAGSLALLSTATLLVLGTRAEAQSVQRQFHIAAQPARSGILSFAQQAGIQMLASAADLEGAHTQAVEGPLSVREGLRRLLASSGLRLISFDGRTALLTRDRVPVRPRQPTRGAPRATPRALPPAAPPTEVVVVGYRQSLTNSTRAKREATGFADAIFAEDMGKFPDTNIAESFNRIPGVTISRDITGEGTNVAIRGLGSNFTQVTLNGAPLAIGSSGITDAQGTDRSVDLSLFATDLFAKLTVNKSYAADLLEGGAAGTIDIRSARPFDRPGSRVAANLQGAKQNGSSRWGGRASVFASATDDTLGALAGVAVNRAAARVVGFETIGWTNPNLSAAQCGIRDGCNLTGGGNWTIPTVVPSGSGSALVPGAQIDRAFLLAHNPGLTIQQIDNAIVPRLAGPSIADGVRDRLNATLSLEWRPDAAMQMYVDALLGLRRYDYDRTTVQWSLRNSASIPLNLSVDRADCSQGCVATGGSFANAQFVSVLRPYRERNRFWGINPGGEWRMGDRLKLEVRANYTRSSFAREVPTVLVSSSGGGGAAADLVNKDGVLSISSNLNLNDPRAFTWSGGRLNLQDERRLNRTKGARADLSWGTHRLTFKVGAKYDDIDRRITALDNSQAWQNAVCGGNPNVTLPSPNGQPPCSGTTLAGLAGDVSTVNPTLPGWPGYGAGYTSGWSYPIVYGGSLVPEGTLAGYLRPGRDGFVIVDWPRFRDASQYDRYHADEPLTGAANTGASGGYIRERSPAFYAQISGKQKIGGDLLTFDAGARLVHTYQTIGGLVSLPDPRNLSGESSLLPNGSRFPNRVEMVYTTSNYDRWLPAANLAYSIGEHAIVRASLSRTMTRPDPNAQLPGIGFASPSADVATIGNPALKPYQSTNIDLGLEFYTGQEGLIAVNVFRKAIRGFTANGIATVPFADLAQYGIAFATLTPTQQAAIEARGGPGASTVQIQQHINASGTLMVNGLELQWTQRLDFLTRLVGLTGFGLQANATIVDQQGSGATPAVALGVAPRTYNVIGFYERGDVSVRIATNFQKPLQSAVTNQNGLPAAGIFSRAYQQWDFSSVIGLGRISPTLRDIQFVVNMTNASSATLSSYFQFSNATFASYKPGRQIWLGLRSSF